MKVNFLISFFFLFSLIANAQDMPADSVVTINNEKLYTIPATESLGFKGQVDAEHYYHHYKGAAVGTLITSLVSPLLGLVPAIACSATKPKIENLGYPDEALMNKPAYNASYSKRAKKIKSRKVWTNWGIGLGVNLVVVLLLSAGR